MKHGKNLFEYTNRVGHHVVKPRRAYPTYADRAGALGFSAERVCAWEGCEARVKSGARMPDPWSNFMVWWSPNTDDRKRLRDVANSPFCRRDWILCGEHTEAFLRLLKPIRR